MKKILLLLVLMPFLSPALAKNDGKKTAKRARAVRKIGSGLVSEKMDAGSSPARLGPGSRVR